jgi:secondary thiamine-phosphate synthase enzyme
MRAERAEMHMWQQREFSLQARPRGFHLVTDEVTAKLPELRGYRVGLLHLWLLHTSASLTINENADPAVRRDFERFFNRLVPQAGSGFADRDVDSGYEHNDEGPDDLPAHFKASLLGCQLTVPITAGQLAMGTWQGIYLGEHRDHGGPRRVLATLQGEVL